MLVKLALLRHQLNNTSVYNNVSCYSVVAATCRKSLDSTNCNEHDGDVYCASCHRRQFGPRGYGFAGGAAGLSTESTVKHLRPQPSSQVYAVPQVTDNTSRIVFVVCLCIAVQLIITIGTIVLVRCQTDLYIMMTIFILLRYVCCRCSPCSLA